MESVRLPPRGSIQELQPGAPAGYVSPAEPSSQEQGTPPSLMEGGRKGRAAAVACRACASPQQQHMPLKSRCSFLLILLSKTTYYIMYFLVVALLGCVICRWIPCCWPLPCNVRYRKYIRKEPRAQSKEDQLYTPVQSCLSRRISLLARRPDMHLKAFPPNRPCTYTTHQPTQTLAYVCAGLLGTCTGRSG